MSKTYSDAIIVGLISLVIGSILFDMLKKEYNKKNEEDSINNDRLIKISFFFTGVIIHLITDHFGINKMYCDKETKKCYRNKNCIFGDCPEKNIN